jgi:hypothetical protein
MSLQFQKRREAAMSSSSLGQLSVLDSPAGRLAVIGSNSLCGLYVLRIVVKRALKIYLRRSKWSRKILVEPGEYSYVGSAFGRGCPLPRRLVRHASRSGHKRPHAFRETLLTEFARCGWGGDELLPPNGKPPRIYNVDHLLDESAAELIGAYAIRLPDPGTTELHREVEGRLGRFLMDDPASSIFEPRLGAQDYRKHEPGKPRQTHLLRVEADECWWESLSARLAVLLLNETSAVRALC